MKYEMHTDEFENTMIRATDDTGLDLWIPADLGNRDYQDYLSWVSAGNQANKPASEDN
jgi:hypothetical protein